MAYRTILLCLNEIDRAPQLLAAARQLGENLKHILLGIA
jgi:hypothetical protein